MNKNENKKSKNKVYVKAELLPEQKEQLQQRAREMGYSVSEYVRLTALDTKQGKEEVTRKASRHIPRCYHLIEKIEDEAIREELKEEMSQLWQCLK